MAINFSQWFAPASWLPSLSLPKIACYHCGERMRLSKALYCSFDGGERAVCCHGCMAILHVIQENHMISDYLRTKSAAQQQ
ncbi:heavy metal translocating P-type ATPase metal-binding domain-containing protein [Undibacterium sp. CCC2.1]|uniref:heavy metal translocating P-type ATPase metal-binding domain-containing protein n=1 Tax=unclassified Undibacterium TaxID=2630295 RepID=UPI002B226D31|nr:MULTISPECIES: heavy metal translocating P-type ATPase metal-binding domain-containing protein [unclassified Undibacterium]MEB0138718.1 heavy metal translocating P-type ATPase metal-binding domain-containing protein [Undibacterium sp. CCC2.1]MEB0171519.1 heavy metal translocating P-type ATPase metal-binding domain-containing protein [Undibacterium sp. CCC1.1]MEB0175410.1 heavy metal translocating P-type ATPase metal-binding domain-containing protein [Undibacterium sp. CCC3.4]MEB0214719.1 heav